MSQRQNLNDFRREFTARCSKLRDMRAAAIVVIIAASLSASACEDCLSFPEVVVHRRTVGDLQYQIGSDVFARNDLEFAESAFRFADDGTGAFPPGTLSFRLGIPGQASSSPPPFLVTIIINDVPLGPSEIDLDDQRAQLSARPTNVADVPYHAVTGHLSIRDLVQDCVANCPTRANGTMDISAVGPNGEALSFTSVTFSAADEVRQGMCIKNGD
jgi:hypothetical protein